MTPAVAEARGWLFRGAITGATGLGKGSPPPSVLFDAQVS